MSHHNSYPGPLITNGGAYVIPIAVSELLVTNGGACNTPLHYLVPSITNEGAQTIPFSRNSSKLSSIFAS